MQDILNIRSQFPALNRMHAGNRVIYLDGPAGTQVPQSVVDRVAQCMLHHNANRSGCFATSYEIDQMMTAAHQTVADFLGTDCWESIAFGPNMTSLTLQFSRAISREWKEGDEILVTNLDHDANFTPWILAARDRGVKVQTVPILSDATLDLDALTSMLNDRTRLVAVTAASNAVGSTTPIEKIATLVHRVGAELFVDAVHYAPHRTIDVTRWNCDFLVCSAYKFFGPHIGILYGRQSRMANLVPYKLRPAPDSLPGRWMTGTQNHACIAGVAMAIEYIASLASPELSPSNRRVQLLDAMKRIEHYETSLIARLISGLQSIDGIRIFGITDSTRWSERAPTVAFTLPNVRSMQCAKWLGERGVFCWHGNYYALPLTTALGVEPHGMVRLGCMHYNLTDEIDRTLDLIDQLRRSF